MEKLTDHGLRNPNYVRGGKPKPDHSDSKIVNQRNERNTCELNTTKQKN